MAVIVDSHLIVDIQTAKPTKQKAEFHRLLTRWCLHPVGKAYLCTNSWLLDVYSTQLALKLAARKALII
ncbi:hypothetical protein CTT31_07825 [Pseudoalteromonas maricaloris]|uniref:hypothetical protein n=1 Tax=Pseudoalteromonas maricaloris TaxID=184924 RepID=UPI0021AE127E|nr:hypothetical protein [Pseudoalteromonas flavipulchra]USE69027.1 hypothetical protein CTT31_07825 [Pseudoalteromonas flavipulchra]